MTSGPTDANNGDAATQDGTTPDAASNNDAAIVPSEVEEPAGGFDALGGLGGLGGAGGLDLGALMGAAQQMMGQMAEAQADLAAQVIEGTSGGGSVRISSTGDGRFTEVRIDASVIDPADGSMLEDLVLAALHDVAQQVSELQAGASPLAGGLPGGLPGGLDLGNLFGHG
jgi:DNA-binding YbaB/EbfC family protein